MTRLLISAAHKSSGKTTVSTGLCAALRKRGHLVQPFKKGPDYIDPLWLGHAAGRPCVNLDFHTQSREEILESTGRYARGADITLIEGNKGLFDGVDLEGTNSNAALARLLNVPVVLVVDCRGVTRGIAPLLLGYQAFDREISIDGVILNRVGGARHESKLRAVVEHYTDVPVLGALQENPELQIVERHLGLVPSNEHDDADIQIDRLAEAVAGQVDLDRIIGLGTDRSPPQATVAAQISPSGARVRIAVARDTAFAFYYHTDLEALESAGAELRFFDTMKDARIPDADALFIGGGFPESHLEALESNRPMRRAILQAIEAGMPAYAECGGLMYLSRSIRWQGRRHEMVGAIAGDITMHARPQGRGYVYLEGTREHPWPGACAHDASGTPPIPAHEFHYSALEPMDPPPAYAYRVVRGHGVDGHHDGIVCRNLLASYSHQRHTRSNPWVTHFVAFIRSCMDRSTHGAGHSIAP
ncbi:cobyrinate a,c-diamide synthase [Thioalkalivibrio thiocyanodenitrificans]|uniref:cobyrinate a,c-diamide synthase n=1 Tax=Thioalkalivibrio thiocyanodenitrificans TaxID=243063 RepID=UPI000361E237|nr:cobyrinate a,c-diamide synthase [Thioalkalivibrio thiocyanodenitrificans]